MSSGPTPTSRTNGTPLLPFAEVHREMLGDPIASRAQLPEIVVAGGAGSKSWPAGHGGHLKCTVGSRGVLVRGVPLLARLALLLGRELLAVLVADVPEARSARGVL